MCATVGAVAVATRESEGRSGVECGRLRAEQRSRDERNAEELQMRERCWMLSAMIGDDETADRGEATNTARGWSAMLQVQSFESATFSLDSVIHST